MRVSIKLWGAVVVLWSLAFPTVSSAEAPASDPNPAFKVFGSTTTIGDVVKKQQAAFYDVDKRKYELVEDAAKEAYLNKYWSDLGKKQGFSADKAQDKYLDSKIKTTEKEVKEVLERFKGHPQLSKLSKEEQEKQVRDYLKERDKRALIDGIIEEGMKSGNLVVLYPKPVEPIMDIKLAEHDVLRFGPNETDTKPVRCKGSDCSITVVEYSDFQCGFCKRVLPDTRKVLETYKGDIVWTVRDFPLDFHPRAIPAAVAARCAAKQGKYWSMYYRLFENQNSLEEADLAKYATEIKLNQNEFKKCVANNDSVMKVISTNHDSGRKLNVTGTPAFFINGRMISGAMPFNEFKKVIDEELAKKKKV